MARTIGKIIKELRKERKMTQEELAGLVGITPQAISRWERGVGYPDITQVVPLAKAFGVSTDEILGANLGNDETQIREYIDLSIKALNEYGLERAIEILKEARAKFPKSYLIKIKLDNALSSYSSRNVLRAGFGQVKINSMMGIHLRGNGLIRPMDGILDDLEINALAVSDGEKTAIMIAVDSCAVEWECVVEFKKSISKATGIPKDAIYLHAIHTHTAPFLRKTTSDPLEKEYFQFVNRKITDVAILALADMKPAKMGFAVGTAPELAFVRRFLMKDGTTKTNPEINDPNVERPIGKADHRVNVLRFDRENADSLVLVNYGNHPDVIGGCKISADWPGALRREVERIIPKTKCIFFNGAQGDVNHINIFPKLDEKERMSESAFGHGYAYSQYIGRCLACAVAQVYDFTKYREVSSIFFVQKMISVPTNMPKPEDMPEAYRLQRIYLEKGLEALPGDEMEQNTLVYETKRMIDFEHGPETIDIQLSAVAIGPIVIIGAPGESFVDIGLELKKTPGWDLVLPTCITNGYYSYLPTKEAFDEGGFEARTSEFKKGIAEIIIEESKKMLNELSKERK
ncbi:MAG: helix-turn-helix transcriptional regulator [Clostridia bacterium]|nr:helix-turn-helix transcriptional regulator [Clostridia bacterium]